MAPSAASSSCVDRLEPKDTDTTLGLINDALFAGADRYVPSDSHTANLVASVITTFVVNVYATESPVEDSKALTTLALVVLPPLGALGRIADPFAFHEEL